jgi:hypothetical protein
LASIQPIFGEFCSCHSIFQALCDLLLGGGRSKKKLICPNLNHSIPKVGTKQFDMGTKNGSKTSYALTNLGNMMLMPKMAKQREFDPCKLWVVPVLDFHKEKIRRVREAQEKNFYQKWLNQLLGFSMTHFSPC